MSRRVRIAGLTVRGSGLAESWLTVSGTGSDGEDTEWEFWLRDCFINKSGCNDLHSDELTTLLQARSWYIRTITSHFHTKLARIAGPPDGRF
jgi:hypothetical protein